LFAHSLTIIQYYAIDTNRLAVVPRTAQNHQTAAVLTDHKQTTTRCTVLYLIGRGRQV